MFRRLSAAVVVLAVLASACTSSAGADAFIPPQATTNARDSAYQSIIESYFEALGESQEYALYAMFVPFDDRCGPTEIASLINSGPAALYREGTFEVDEVDLAEAGEVVNPSFDLIERRGSTEKALRIDRFLPIVETDDRLRFNADACDWFTHFGTANGDAEVRALLEDGLAALQTFAAESGDYGATPNDLRYIHSGLAAVSDLSDLAPGKFILASSRESAVLAGLGLSGTWYCVAVGQKEPPRYGAGLDFESVASWEMCVAASSVGSW